MLSKIWYFGFLIILGFIPTLSLADSSVPTKFGSSVVVLQPGVFTQDQIIKAISSLELREHQFIVDTTGKSFYPSKTFSEDQPADNYILLGDKELIRKFGPNPIRQHKLPFLSQNFASTPEAHFILSPGHLENLGEEIFTRTEKYINTKISPTNLALMSSSQISEISEVDVHFLIKHLPRGRDSRPILQGSTSWCGTLADYQTKFQDRFEHIPPLHWPNLKNIIFFSEEASQVALTGAVLSEMTIALGWALPEFGQLTISQFDPLDSQCLNHRPNRILSIPLANRCTQFPDSSLDLIGGDFDAFSCPVSTVNNQNKGTPTALGSGQIGQTNPSVTTGSKGLPSGQSTASGNIGTPKTNIPSNNTASGATSNTVVSGNSGSTTKPKTNGSNVKPIAPAPKVDLESALAVRQPTRLVVDISSFQKRNIVSSRDSLNISVSNLSNRTRPVIVYLNDRNSKSSPNEAEIRDSRNSDKFITSSTQIFRNGVHRFFVGYIPTSDCVLGSIEAAKISLQGTRLSDAVPAEITHTFTINDCSKSEQKLILSLEVK